METKKTYSQKLLDPRWQRKRLEILNRDNFTCQSCDQTENTLHVHHRVYQSNDPWETDSKHLVTLCADCHEYETSKKSQYEREFLNHFYKAGFLPSHLVWLDYGFYHMKQLLDRPEIITHAFGHALSNPELQAYILKAHADYQQKLRDTPFKGFLKEMLDGE